MKSARKLIAYALLTSHVVWVTVPTAFAAPPGPLDLSQSPLFFGFQQKPIVMLNLTKDHQLHFKAYTDYSDLDEDGVPELTYKHSFDYYGYWDAKKCYSYSNSGSGLFTPTGYSADKYCGGTGWSGNFLNWVATSRLDSVRKILYGGKRSTDGTTQTVLERSFLPMDAHSWAKFYDGADLNKLVPASILPSFTVSGAATTYNSSGAVTATTMATAGNYIVDSAVSARIGDQVKLSEPVSKAIRYARVTAISGSRITVNIPNAAVGVVGTVPAAKSAWQIENMSASGLTFCNTTYIGSDVSSQSATAQAALPLIRVARGNVELWAANERWQCQFLGEKASNSGGGFSAGGQNGNYFPLSGLKSNAESPPNNAAYKVADYTARIEACVNQSGGSDTTDVWAKREGCKQYGANWKPVGVLQKQEGFKYGLFTGSYAKNISGGVLRSNAGDFSLEVDANGRFVDPSTSTALAAKGSIVKSLDAIRMTGYSYGDGTYMPYDGDCTFQLIDLVPSGASGNKRNQGACSSWGNPIAEMYTESLRYLAGANANTNFTYSTGSVDATIGLSVVTWQDPINTNNYCVPLRNIIFNAATTSYDGDQVNMTGIAGAGAGTAASGTNTVGSYEGITAAIAGKVGSTATTAADFNACTTKTGSLADFRGICPEGAPYSGSYLTAGAAYFARNNRIRATPTLSTSAASAFPNAYTVETYGVSLAANTPKVDILDSAGKNVVATITPAYRLPKSDGVGGGTIVDFKVIELPDFTKTIVTGSYYLNWEDSGFGGDFDQDVVGRLAFRLDRTKSPAELTVTTSAYNQSTANPQGFGYVLSGTNVDGPHFHSGILGFNYTNPVSSVVECNNCQVAAAPTSQTYTLTGTSGKSLKDPLYYAAKWGAIRDPGSATSDLFDKKGRKDASGNDLPDGIPDNFFSVSNPAKLAEQLESLFARVASGSSSSSAAASTTRASSDTLVFTASFTDKWGGTVKAFSVNVSPTVTFTEDWDAATTLNGRTGGRNLFTMRTDTRAGTAFTWSNLSAAQQTQLGSEDVQKYIAGDRSKEGSGPTDFRKREPSVIGDIINSNPAYASDRPDFGGSFGALPGYADFFKQFDPRQGGTKRTRAIYVGTNGGMLHSFVADSKASSGGNELFGYVPSMVYGNLPLLSQQSYSASGGHRYFVDGSPFVSDVNVGSGSSPSWKTMLIGGLGAGGAGYFALDVTRPESFSASNVMWEFKASDVPPRSGKSATDLGASTSQARIARTKVGGSESWFAVFGNGYNSVQTPTAGEAVLFVAKLGKGAGAWSEGSDFYRLVMPGGGTDNGLTTPTPIDYDRDGFVDFIYVGDLQGNMWRIDARGPNPASWPAYKLFDSPTGQPITTAPQVTRHPNGGAIVLFGTGKYLEASDVNVTPSVQAMYGVIDKDPTVAPTTQSVSDLNSITITNRTLPVAGVAGAQCKNDKGWYANLQNGSTVDGERVIFDSALVAGNLFTPTLVPSADICLGGGRSYLYSINPFTGCASDSSSAKASESLGVQSTPRFIAIPSALVGRNDTTGGGRSITADASGRQTTSQRVIIIGNAEGTPNVVGGDPKTITSTSGRMSWREIVEE